MVHTFGIIEEKIQYGLFGASLRWILKILPYLKENNIYPLWQIDTYYYGPLFPTILKQKTNNTKSTKKISLTTIKKNYSYIYKGHEFQKAHDLFFEYFDINDDILSEVQVFNKDFGNFTLGIHYRGTDKFNAHADFVSKDDFINQVQAYLSKNKQVDTIFIASDEEIFINKMKDAFMANYNLIFTSATRSSTNMPIHKNSNDKFLAKQAMIDSLLLSKCNFVIKTSSCLSDWVKIWNPSIEVYNVNTFRNDWFPQAMIPVRSFL